LGAEPGTVIYQEDRSAPTTGDGEHPFAAITFPSPPNGPATFTHSDAVENETGFVMPYRLSVAPGAAATVQMNFSEAYSLEEIERASGEAVAAYTPTLVVASPIAGAVLTSSEVTAAGDVSGEGGSSTLTVNGIPVEVRPDDTWSKVVSLRPGANTLVVVATGADGVTKTDEVAVSYVPPNDEEPVENGPVGKEPTQAGRGEEDPFEVRLTEPGLVEDLPAAGLDGKAPTSGKPAHERADAHRGNHKARSRAKSHRRKKTRRRTSERLRKKRKRR
jgi:hypothetical protein